MIFTDTNRIIYCYLLFLLYTTVYTYMPPEAVTVNSPDSSSEITEFPFLSEVSKSLYLHNIMYSGTRIYIYLIWVTVYSKCIRTNVIKKKTIFLKRFRPNNVRTAALFRFYIPSVSLSFFTRTFSISKRHHTIVLMFVSYTVLSVCLCLLL